ncbi:MAG: arylsulfatase [Phycisphaeraceae bacterium]
MFTARHLIICLILALASNTWLDAARAADAAAQPNIILVITDDQGYGDIGAHGNTMIRTPNLDRLHGQSIRLTDYHVDPTCSPTRSALLTGRYSSRTGVWHTIMGRSIMASDEVTLAELLHGAGYRTAAFGKWHLGDNYPCRPQDQGFEHTVVHGGGGIGQTPDFWGNDYFDDTFWVDGSPTKFEGYCTDVFFREALKFIEKCKGEGKPFFVYLPTNVPHGPFNVAEKYSKPYVQKGVPQAMANFYGMIENADENMGVLMKKLDDWKLAENTILIFTTDNGTAGGAGSTGGGRADAKGKNKKGDSTWPGFNAGMRATKGSQYEGGHRVPFFIRWPNGKLGQPRDIEAITAHIDVLPTLCDLTGVKVPAELKIDGTSLVPLLKDQKVEWSDRTLFVHSQRIELPKKWKTSAVMTEQWRLIDGKSLYDIKADPGQQNDIAGKHPAVVEKLRGEYDKWWDSISTRFDDYVRIAIGSEKENPARLTAHDWHTGDGPVPWNQNMIKANTRANGYWAIHVEKAGRYAFTLRRFPAEEGKPIGADVARIQVGDAKAFSSIAKDATSVTIEIDLKAGPAKFQSWFGEGEKDTGAFFVEVERK